MSRQKPAGSRRWRPASLVVNLLLVAMAGGLALGATQVFSGRWRVAPVLSGSMRPNLAVGGVVVAQRVPVSSLAVGDVIIVTNPWEPQNTVVHRIVSLQRTSTATTISTKGDSNALADPWGSVRIQGQTAYRVSWSLPLLGYAGVWLHDTSNRARLMFFGGVLLLLGLIYAATPARFRHRLRLRRPAATAATAKGSAPAH